MKTALRMQGFVHFLGFDSSRCGRCCNHPACQPRERLGQQHSATLGPLQRSLSGEVRNQDIKTRLIIQAHKSALFVSQS